MHHHPGLGEGEAQKHPHRIEGDQPGDAAAKDHDQHPGKATEGQDSVAKHQPIAQGSELAGQVAVLGQEVGQAGEVGVGRIGGEEQDQQGRHLQHQHHRVVVTKNLITQLVEQGGPVFDINRAQLLGEHAHPAKHHGE